VVKSNPARKKNKLLLTLYTLWYIILLPQQMPSVNDKIATYFFLLQQGRFDTRTHKLQSSQEEAVQLEYSAKVYF
jgi:hypothetical protein